MSLHREFSWSLSRSSLFFRCRRAYYLHYYASWGGWRNDADEKSSEAYRLKKLQSTISFANVIFREAVSYSILEGSVESNRLVSVIRRRAESSAYRRIREFRGAASPDMECVDFVERFYQNANYDDLLSIVLKNLDVCLVNLSDSPALQLLKTVPYLNFIQFKKPSFFMFEGVKVWTAPDFLWREGSTVKGLNLFTCDPAVNAGWSRKSRIDAMLAESLRPTSIARVESAFLHAPLFPLIDFASTRSEISNWIKCDIEAMLAVTKLDSDIREELFPATEIDDYCAICPFYDLCR